MASRAAKRFVDLSGKMTKLLHLILILRLSLGLCWWMIHLVFSIYTFGPRLLQFIESYIISTGLLERYKNLQLHKLRYLAVVVDSKEARYTQKIKKLLCWLSDIGVNYLILYDMEGVLKESLKGDLSDITKGMTSVPCQDQMTIELLSFADSKEGVAKAASFWYTKHMKDEIESYERKDPNITETDMSSALEAVGCGGPEPDLLLVYAPVRCHIGFPAWRMRYTEILYMIWRLLFVVNLAHLCKSFGKPWHATNVLHSLLPLFEKFSACDHGNSEISMGLAFAMKQNLIMEV